MIRPVSCWWCILWAWQKTCHHAHLSIASRVDRANTTSAAPALMHSLTSGMMFPCFHLSRTVHPIKHQMRGIACNAVLPNLRRSSQYYNGFQPTMSRRILEKQVIQDSKNRTMSSSTDTKPSGTRPDAPSPWQQHFYRYFLPIQTRVDDTDWFGHINNAVYYSYFDAIINHYLIRQCGLKNPKQDTHAPNIVGFMVDTRCTYKRPLNYPEAILAGLAVTKLGKSSVTYTVGVFSEKDISSGSDSETHTWPSVRGNIVDSTHVAGFSSHGDVACAVGQCVHVFVDLNGDQRPVTIPDITRIPLERIYIPYEDNISKL